MSGYTEDSPEVYRAACALSHYYEGDGGDAEDWMGGAIVALRAAFEQDKPSALGHLKNEAGNKAWRGEK